MDPERFVRVARRLMVAAALLYAFAGVSTAARADEATPAPDVAPVTSLFQRVHAAFPGRILTVELALSDPPAYEVKLLTKNGNVLKLSYDAVTLHLDSVVGHRDRDDEGTGSIVRGNREAGGGDNRDDRSGQDGRDGRDDRDGDDD